MIVKEHQQSIAVSANWIDEFMMLELKRDGKEIAYQELFGEFDSSMNQTDRVLTKDSSWLVQRAQPGDQLVIKAHGCYIFKMTV